MRFLCCTECVDTAGHVHFLSVRHCPDTADQVYLQAFVVEYCWVVWRTRCTSAWWRAGPITAVSLADTGGGDGHQSTPLRRVAGVQAFSAVLRGVQMRIMTVCHISDIISAWQCLQFNSLADAPRLPRGFGGA
jgi:hypothetical protein